MKRLLTILPLIALLGCSSGGVSSSSGPSAIHPVKQIGTQKGKALYQLQYRVDGTGQTFFATMIATCPAGARQVNFQLADLDREDGKFVTMVDFICLDVLTVPTTPHFVRIGTHQDKPLYRLTCRASSDSVREKSCLGTYAAFIDKCKGDIDFVLESKLFPELRDIKVFRPTPLKAMVRGKLVDVSIQYYTGC